MRVESVYAKLRGMAARCAAVPFGPGPASLRLLSCRCPAQFPSKGEPSNHVCAKSQVKSGSGPGESQAKSHSDTKGMNSDFGISYF